MAEQTEIIRKSADNTNTRLELPPGEVRVSVRNLVEFVLRQGDIDNRHAGSVENAMLEGGRIHRKIQRSMGAEYQAEVSLRYTMPCKNYILVVEGRADGIIEKDDRVVIDEIKGTYRAVEYMKEPVPVHLAQAKCYAYIYGLQHELEEIGVRLTYCNMESEEIRYFHFDYTFRELEEWYQQLLREYLKWSDYSWEWKQKRQVSIEALQFPFAYRQGQKELVEHVYKTIYHKKKLFLEAPTGVGKTISTVFPAVKAIGKGMGERIFYLTAKTITRTVAEETFQLLRENGLRFKSVVLTAKDKICFMEETECNPEYCPYAKGHFDRVNGAMFDLLTHEESFSREKIEEYALKHQVCPFEFCLDMSLFADAVIGDYNYLFDPHVYLKRFFAEGNRGEHLFLIDEAHNLLDRGREMYSAVLEKEKFLQLRRLIKATVASEISQKSSKNAISGQLTLEMTLDKTEVSGEYNNAWLEIKEEKNTHTPRSRGHSRFVRKGYGERIIHFLESCNKVMLSMKRECSDYQMLYELDELVKPLMRLNTLLEEYLAEQEEYPLEIKQELLDFYFNISHFLDIYERVDEHYVKYSQLCDDGTFQVKLFCVDPGRNLQECMQRGRSSILFSATFLPIQYYKALLGGDEEDYEVYARSVFDQSKRGLFIAGDVTSKYTRRSDEEYLNIACYIKEIVAGKAGNYMVFCPSYQFLRTVYDKFTQYYMGDWECLIQQEFMREEEREEFLERFRSCSAGTLVGFCVLGGIFSEGIDLKNDSLIGSIIVGTGIPQVCVERQILKQYFDSRGESGFDYAYRFPGLNKVLQAGGRVIRTAEDIGVVALLDERFRQGSYQRLFPREWYCFQPVRLHDVGQRVHNFWQNWNNNGEENLLPALPNYIAHDDLKE
ncbi:MAG: ATP-dependent DNA helicase [Lachnospiraceae bacterium]|nr:ATP-dependent DNA helicase [Lachnospiraceae bacterium]